MTFRPDVYAIDFGTSNSLLAAANAEAVEPPLPLDPGADDPTLLRTILFFPDARRCFYGTAALAAYAEHGMQGRLIRSIKKHLPSRSLLGTYIDERPMRLEDLVGAFLGDMRRRANQHYGVEVTRALLGRPARFSDDPLDDAFAERRLETAARVAGFTDVRFCPEPIAAARDFRERLDQDRTVLVADFGAGTSDFTVLRMGPGAYDPRDVLAIGGVSIAGDALDGSIMRKKIAAHFGADVRYKVPLGANLLTMPKPIVEALCSPADLSLLGRREARTFLRDIRGWSVGPDDRARMDRLFTLIDDGLGFSVFEAIERVKRELSSRADATFVFDYPSIELLDEVSRAEFERAAERPIDAILGALDATVLAAGLDHGAIDLVCCTGGTAKVPRIGEAIHERFGRDKVVQHRSFHSVILGLAERAQAMAMEPAPGVVA